MPRNSLTVLPLAALMLLAACGDGNPASEPPDLDQVQTDGDLEASLKALPAGDFRALTLGYKVAGSETKTRLTNEAGAFADMTSYVACPAALADDGTPVPPIETGTCDPSVMPEGTVYTYVQIVYPGEDNDPDHGSGNGADSSTVESADLFRLVLPAYGFTGRAGYSKAEARAAVGENADVVISCEGESIAWTIEAGDGGNQWGQGEPITFYWQSTLPPARPAQAYEIFANAVAASGQGAFPAPIAGAGNFCDNPAAPR